MQHGFLLSAVLAVIGLTTFVFAGPSLPEGRLIGSVNLVVALGLFLFVFRSARDRQPRMVLDREGIWFRDWGLDKIPWQQVMAVYPSGGRLQNSLCIEVRDAEAVFAGLLEGQHRKLIPNRLVQPPRLLVPNGALDAPLEDILAAIRDVMARVRA